MTISQLLLGFICVIAISIGNIFIKLAVLNISGYDSTLSLIFKYINKYFVIGILIYILAAALWMHLLILVPLSRAYPIIALSFIIVPILSSFFLGEDIGVKVVIGGMLIVFGVYISTRGFY